MPRIGPPALSPEDQSPSQIGLEALVQNHLHGQGEREQAHREQHGPGPAQWERLQAQGPQQALQMDPVERMQTFHGVVREAVDFYRNEVRQQREHSQQREQAGVPVGNAEAARLEASRWNAMDDRMRQIDTLMTGQQRIPVDNVERHRQIFDAINQRLDDVMQLHGAPARPDLERIRNLDDLRPRMPHQTLGLDREGRYLQSDPDGLQPPSPAHGGYVFVVPVSNPSEIWLGQRANGGHTAISRGGDVYFAGEIEFEHGRLVRWDNNSGHYKPEARLHEQLGSHAIGTLETLLPRDKFDPRHG